MLRRISLLLGIALVLLTCRAATAVEVVQGKVAPLFWLPDEPMPVVLTDAPSPIRFNLMIDSAAVDDNVDYWKRAFTGFRVNVLQIDAPGPKLVYIPEDKLQVTYYHVFKKLGYRRAFHCLVDVQVKDGWPVGEYQVTGRFDQQYATAHQLSFFKLDGNTVDGALTFRIKCRPQKDAFEGRMRLRHELERYTNGDALFFPQKLEEATKALFTAYPDDCFGHAILGKHAWGRDYAGAAEHYGKVAQQILAAYPGKDDAWMRKQAPAPTPEFTALDFNYWVGGGDTYRDPWSLYRYFADAAASCRRHAEEAAERAKQPGNAQP